MQEYGGYGAYGGYPPPPQPPRRPGVWRYVAVAIAAGALGAGTVLAIGHTSGSPVAEQAPAPSSSAPQTDPNQGGGFGNGGNGNGGFGNGGNGGNSNGGFGSGDSNGNGGVSGLSSADQAIYNKVKTGLVIINDSLNYQAESAAGTGMVLTSSGLVLTNNHVVENATSITATVLATGKTYKVQVLGYDKTGDIAAVQLEGASGLQTIQTGNSSAVKTGDAVLAMGNAEGVSEIVPAAGQITALNQTITASDDSGDTSETLHGMMRTNADIVSGDSGGALANSSGQVIGMNTAGDNVQYSGQTATGFAIPINTALAIAHQISAGRASDTVYIGDPGFLGVVLATTSSASPPQEASDERRYLIQHGTGTSFSSGSGGELGACIANSTEMTAPDRVAPVAAGALIVDVFCGTAADAAGMAAGDVIISVNGQAITTGSSLMNLTGKYRPGAVVSIGWVSLGGRKHTTSIKLKTGPVR